MSLIPRDSDPIRNQGLLDSAWAVGKSFRKATINGRLVSVDMSFFQRKLGFITFTQFQPYNAQSTYFQRGGFQDCKFVDNQINVVDRVYIVVRISTDLTTAGTACRLQPGWAHFLRIESYPNGGNLCNQYQQEDLHTMTQCVTDQELTTNGSLMGFYDHFQAFTSASVRPLKPNDQLYMSNVAAVDVPNYVKYIMPLKIPEIFGHPCELYRKQKPKLRFYWNNTDSIFASQDPGASGTDTERSNLSIDDFYVVTTGMKFDPSVFGKLQEIYAGGFAWRTLSPLNMTINCQANGSGTSVVELSPMVRQTLDAIQGVVPYLFITIQDPNSATTAGIIDQYGGFAQLTWKDSKGAVMGYDSIDAQVIYADAQSRFHTPFFTLLKLRQNAIGAVNGGSEWQPTYMPVVWAKNPNLCHMGIGDGDQSMNNNFVLEIVPGLKWDSTSWTPGTNVLVTLWVWRFMANYINAAGNYSFDKFVPDS